MVVRAHTPWSEDPSLARGKVLGDGIKARAITIDVTETAQRSMTNLSFLAEIVIVSALDCGLCSLEEQGGAS